MRPSLALLLLVLAACAGPVAEQRTASALIVAACAQVQSEVLARTHAEADWNAAKVRIREACSVLAEYAP